jgi:hypothetical protein
MNSPVAATRWTQLEKTSLHEDRDGQGLALKNVSAALGAAFITQAPSRRG